MSAPLRIASFKKHKGEGSLEELAEELTESSGPFSHKALIGGGRGGRRAGIHMLEGNGGPGPGKKKAAGKGKKKPVSTTQPDPIKDYFARLIKLIPAEVVGLYLAGIGVIPKDSSTPMWGWAVFCLVMVFLSRSYATSDKNQGIPVEWPAVLIAAVSYCIWVYVSPGPLASLNAAQPYIGSLLILGWTALVPKLYNPQ